MMAPNDRNGRHQRRVVKAKEAIDDVFGDTHVSPMQTRESLEELSEHIRSMLATLEGP
jgi:hypothetical protein